ncbi:bacteriocin immunity protein [Lactobacillus xylocopicola]|uniref:Bacteriocin immunity protein n=1 Tax=Lactobacillus xylocopicola TaxID=2976676 RepID=A0ABN6SIZ7_9LACO|nr:bacteriocin immunity protein [Lactobacillus xylocopicola]BDR60140.1 bacteriocin immunity protein [Lactobacillus xylocopicola]
MQAFFIGSSAQKRDLLNKEVYQELEQFYCSFFSNIYNELNIAKYKHIRDAIGLVMRKFDACDHPLAYTGKLVMYIQGQLALNHLQLTKQQRQLLHKLADQTKNINLNFVYSGPLTDAHQFSSI